MNMDTEIHRIRMGLFTNCFVVKGDHAALLVDAGFPNHENHFFRQIRRLGIQPGDIRLIVATHGHADHVGSLQALKNHTTARVAVHQADSHLVRHGIVVVPPAVTAWGQFLSLVFRTFSFLGRFQPVEPEIIVEREFSLEVFGIPGRIIPTPGHTAGSVSVILKSGEAFVGDLAVNAFPMGMGLGIPALAQNVQDIYASWEKLLSAGVTTIYPAHGTPFPAERLKRKLPGERRKVKGDQSSSNSARIGA